MLLSFIFLLADATSSAKGSDCVLLLNTGSNNQNDQSLLLNMGENSGLQYLDRTCSAASVACRPE